MKKLIYNAAALALAFFAASCQQENLEPVAGGNTVTYTVQVPDAIATKAIGENVNAVNELVYAVYRTEALSADDHEKAELKLFQKTAEINNGTATVTFELVNNQNFRVLFWAQVNQPEGKDIYNTQDLKNVTLKQSLSANAEDYAAFAGSDYIKSGDNISGRTITLKRPVSQLNIATTLGSLIIEGQTNVEIGTTAVTVNGLSNTYNVATGLAEGESSKFVYEATNPDVLSEHTLNVNGTTYSYISMNYVGFAAAKDNASVTYYINTNNVGTIFNTIDNVPFKANYRTNIIGNLITSTSDYTITLDGAWESTYVGPEFVQEPAYDADSKTWTVTNAMELAWVAASVNGTIGLNTKAAAGCKTFEGETVVLANDIDLKGAEWEPIGLPGAFFTGTFDGQNHVISNFKVTEKDGYVGLFGYARATIKDLSVKNVTLRANHYAGGIVGQGYVNIDNCHAEDINIIVTIDTEANDFGDKAGAIVGQNCEGAKSITNCTAKNVIIEGYRDLGGIAGMAHDRNIVTGNSIENVTIIQNLAGAYKSEVPTTLGAIVGRQGNNVTFRENSGEATIEKAIAPGVCALETEENAEGSTVVTVYGVYAAEGLQSLANMVDGKEKTCLFEDKTVKLVTDIDLLKVNDNGEQICFDPIGSYRNDKAFTGTFDGQGHTIKNLYQNTWELNNGYYYGDLGLGLFAYVENATIKNLVIDTANISGESALCGVVAATAYGECTFENITVKNAKCADYQYYAGGIVAWASGKHQYINCNVDASTVIAAQWGDFDNSTGGVIGGAGGSAEIYMKDCNVACRLDVYNDVTSSYQWYAYRRCGMLIGNSGKTEKIGETTYAVAPQLTCDNVTVTYGDWMNYSYCEFAGTSWPYVRVQAGVSNSAYSNPRYGHPTDANGNTVVDDNHAHNEGEDHHLVLPFNQLYGGGQGVYGTPSHEGVTVIYPESYYRHIGYKANADTYTVYSGAGFKKVATEVLSDASKTVTIKLANDIDLAGIEWPAVATKAAFVLDGKGNAIKNLTTTAVEDHGFYSTAMFTSTRKAATIKNLVVENATVSGKGGDNSHGAVLVACNYDALNIEGVTVKNSTVSNCDRSSVIATYLYFTDAVVKNCVVEGCTVNSIGTAGALLGMNNSNNFEATGNTVKNTTVASSEGSNKAGILIGTWQSAGTLTESNNVVENSKAINADVETNNNVGRTA